jgi:hypothetical protein
MVKPLIDNWDFLLWGQRTEREFRGYVSSIDPTTAALGMLIGGSQNTYKSLLGTIKNRNGLKRRGPADETEAGVISSFEWQTSLGATRVLRAANGKLQVELEVNGVIEYFNLLTGLTDEQMQFSFAPWYSEDLGKDELILVNGGQELNMWPGGIAAIVEGNADTGIIGIIRGPNYDNSAPDDLTSGGIGYTVGDELTISGGNGDAILVVDSLMDDATSVATIAVNAGGTNYSIGDIVRINGGNAAYHCILRVTNVSGTAVTGLAVVEVGYGYAVSSAQAVTAILSTLGGTGLTVDILTLGRTIEAWHFSNNGSGYSTGDEQTTTGGTGTGATIAVVTVYSNRITIGGDFTAEQLGFPGSAPASDSTNTITGGTLNVNGTPYVYSGIGDDGFSFIGVSPDPSALGVGDVAVAEVETSTETASGNLFSIVWGAAFFADWIATIGNQLYVGCYTARTVFIAGADNYLNYAVPSFRAPGDPDLLILDTNSRGSASKTGQKGNGVVFGSQGDSYSLVRQVENFITSDGATAFVYETVLIDKSTSSDLSSPLGQDFIASIGDTIIFLDESNQLRQFGTLRNLNTPVYPILSLDVYTELRSIDFTGGALRTVSDESGETVYLAAPITGTLFLYQIRNKIDEVGNLVAERLWQPPFIVNASRIAVIDAVVYVYSNSNPQMYQLWDTGQFYDDSPADEEIPYECHATFAYVSGNRRTQQVFFDKIFYEGYMTRGTSLYNNVYQEFGGSKNILTVTVNKATNPGRKKARFYDPTQVPSLGDVSLGEVPLGEGVTAQTPGQLPKFRAVRSATGTDLFEFALDVFSFEANAQWELLCMGVNVQDTPRRATSLTITS